MKYKIMMNKLASILLVNAVLIFYFVSCIGGDGVSKKDVELLMNEYFEKVKQNDFSLIEDYYSDAFYEATSKEEWKDTYEKIHDTLGDLISIKLTSYNIISTIGTSNSGRTFTFIYKNKYENGEATETITLFAPRGKDEVKINAHNYVSNTFSKNLDIQFALFPLRFPVNFSGKDNMFLVTGVS